MQVVIDSILTNYEITGEGKVVLLIHGWGDNLRTFQGLTEELSKNYKIITLDLPGFGATSVPGSAWGLDEYAKFIALFMQKLDVAKPLAILGHSNGGAIAIRGLAKQILEADKLILLAAAGIRSEYKSRKAYLRAMARIAKTALRPLPKAVQKSVKHKAYKKIGSDLFVAENLQETFKKIVTDDTQGDAKSIKIPSLIIYGSDDEATPIRYGKIYHSAIVRSQLSIIDGADHFLHQSHLKVVTSLIEEFLS